MFISCGNKPRPSISKDWVGIGREASYNHLHLEDPQKNGKEKHGIPVGKEEFHTSPSGGCGGLTRGAFCDGIRGAYLAFVVGPELEIGQSRKLPVIS